MLRHVSAQLQQRPPAPRPHPPARPNLDDLRVSKNPDLVTLPPFFAGFPRLAEFYAFNCKIEVLPEELARCKVLTKIMVAGNRLSSIPDPVARSAVRLQPLPHRLPFPSHHSAGACGA